MIVTLKTLILKKEEVIDMKENAASKKIEYGTLSNPSKRIVADGVSISNDTRLTGLNNNTLVLGPSGAGKTRNFLLPNVMQCNSSMVIVDVKGDLCRKLTPVLEKSGYTVHQLDFKNLNSDCRWNTLDGIGFDKERGCYSERDIAKVSTALCPVNDYDEPVWNQLSSQYLSMLISYTLDFLPEDEHHLGTVLRLFEMMDTPEFDTMMNKAMKDYPDSTASRYYLRIRSNKDAEKFHASIKGILSNHLQAVSYGPALAMYTHPTRFEFKELGETPTALFVNVSDVDHSLDTLIGLFYIQLIQGLIDFADKQEDGKLPIPVHLMLDDFSAIKINDFDQYCSVTRSRNVYFSIILQSVTQLTGLFGDSRAQTIIDNCDTIIFMGGNSLQTADMISARTNLPVNEVLDLPLDEEYLIVRGQKPRRLKKYNVQKHERYNELDEAQTECIDTIDAFPDIESAQDA